MKLLDRLCAWSEEVTRFTAWVGLTLLACATLVTVLDILTRRTIGWSVPGLVDLTQLFVMGFVFLSIPFAFTREANVSVEFVTDPLPDRALAMVKATGALAATGFMIALSWYCLFRAQQQLESGDASQTIGIPFIWNWIPLMIGLVIGIIASLLQTLRYARFGLFGTGSAQSGQSAQV
jgi:TRAP-type C4-dicarboxylate transport system permease small subunit